MRVGRPHPRRQPRRVARHRPGRQRSRFGNPRLATGLSLASRPVYVRRSFRKDGDTKTGKPRRTLKIPDDVAWALKERHAEQAKRVGECWTPRQLRHSFVSILCDYGVTIEQTGATAMNTIFGTGSPCRHRDSKKGRKHCLKLARTLLLRVRGDEMRVVDAFVAWLGENG